MDAAVDNARIAAPAPKMNTINNKVVDQHLTKPLSKKLLGKRKHAAVHKPTTTVATGHQLPTPRSAHKNFDGGSSSCCLTTTLGTKLTNIINHEAQSYTLYSSECTKVTSITGSADKRRRIDDYIER